MGIQIADNFLYQSRKPLDSRLVFDTIADMVNTAESIIYEGILVYNKETKKLYQFDPANDIDADLGKWRELQAGSSSSIEFKEYIQGAEYKENEIILYKNNLYIVKEDFTAQSGYTDDEDAFNSDLWDYLINTGKSCYLFDFGTRYEIFSFAVFGDLIAVVADTFTTDVDDGTKSLSQLWQEAIDNNKIIVINAEPTFPIVDYNSDTDYVEDQIVKLNGKLYLVLKDFTSRPIVISLEDSLRTDLLTGNLALVDTHSAVYEQGVEYRATDLVIYEHKLYHVHSDFRSDDTQPTLAESLKLDIANDFIHPINTDTDTHFDVYEQGKEFNDQRMVIHNDKLYITTVDFVSDDTQGTIEESLQLDIQNGNLIAVDTNVDTNTVEYLQNTYYGKGSLITFNKRLYIVLNDYTSDNTETNIDDSLALDIANGHISQIEIDVKKDGYCQEYLQGIDLIANQLVYLDSRLARVAISFTTDDTEFLLEDSFNKDVADGNLLEVCDCDDMSGTVLANYSRDTDYSANMLLYLDNRLVRVVSDYTSSNEPTILESYTKDIDDGFLIEISGGSGGDAELNSNITSNITVGAAAAGTIFPKNMTFTEFAKKILTREIEPVMNFSATGTGLKEQGTAVNGSTLTCAITTVGTTTIGNIEFYINGTLIDTQGYVDGTTSYQYVYDSSITSNTEFKAKLYYTLEDGSVKSIEKSAKITFVYPSYYGIVSSIIADSASGVDIPNLGLSKTIKDKKAFTWNGINMTAARIVYIYPASFGNLTSIKDANNFEYIGSYTKNTITDSITSVSYIAYTLTDPVTVTNFKQDFS